MKLFTFSLFLLISIPNVFALPCTDWSTLFRFPLNSNELGAHIIREIVIQDNNEEPVTLSFDSVEIDQGIIRFQNPRFNRYALSTHEQFCLEVAIPRWHPTPQCVRSELRETIVSFCESLGLRPAQLEGQYLYESEIVSTRRHGRVYIQYMNQWHKWDVRPIGPHFNHPIITSVSCGL